MTMTANTMPLLGNGDTIITPDDGHTYVMYVPGQDPVRFMCAGGILQTGLVVVQGEHGGTYALYNGARYCLSRCRSAEEIREALQDAETQYRNIYRIGAHVELGELGPPYVPRGTLEKVLDPETLQTFYKLFGIQTVCANGMYPWDVEAVLERMHSGRLTGSQALWD